MFRWLTQAGSLAAALAGMAAIAAAQSDAPRTQNPVEVVQSQVDELRRAIDELRGQLAESRRETQSLREELRAAGLKPASPSESAAHSVELGDSVPDAENLAGRVSALAEDQQLTAAKVDEQYQTKVASGSRYRLQLSGLVLLNVFNNRGAVDNLDVPGIAQNRTPFDSAGAFGASLRQTQLTLAVSGPELAGAKTSGEVTADFFGGFPATPEGVTAGLMRLRTARVALDWKDTTLAGAQESPFFSPNSPTSLVSIAYPALGGAGNIWTWTPQIYVDHRIRLAGDSSLVLEGGVLDPLTGEVTSEYNRLATAGERSRNPAWAMRVGWQRTANQRTASFGTGGYFSRQDWGFGRSIDAWVATVDWDLPLGPWFSVSGEVYRGQAIAGLGGGESPGVFFSGEPAAATTLVTPAASAGGWSQLKFRPTERLEFNGAFGEDQVFHSGLFRFPFTAQTATPVRRNSSGFANIIYRPRTNLLFSLEYRRLWTVRPGASEAQASQLGAAAGVLF